MEVDLLCFGVVAAGGTANIVWVEGRMDSTKYQEILEANFQRSVHTEVEERLGIPARQWSKAYLKINHEVHPGKTDEGFGMARNSRSPQTWILLRICGEIFKLEVFCPEEWGQISKVRIERLLAGYRKRSQAVIVARGVVTLTGPNFFPFFIILKL